MFKKQSQEKQANQKNWKNYDKPNKNVLISLRQKWQNRCTNNFCQS